MRMMQCVWMVFSVCAVLAVSSSTAFAQRGGGGRGLMGYNRVQLSTLKEVQAELKLSDDQKKLVTEVNEKYTSDMRDLRQNAGGDFAGMMEKSTKLANDASAKVLDKLDDAQKSRLMQIFVQVNGANALADAAIQKELKISEEQVKKLVDARAANREAMMGAFGSLQGASQEERQSKMQELNKAANENLFACISSDQKAAFDKLGGSKLEVDLSPLAPRRQNN